MPTVMMPSASSHTITTHINNIEITRKKPRKMDIVNQMYKIEWPECNENSLSEKLDRVMGTLTLFAPDQAEKEAMKKSEVDVVWSLNEPRPVTPINDEIREPPTSIKRLFRYIKRRISPRPNVQYLTEADQLTLADILIGEVQFIWQDIRRQIDDPFLSMSENTEMSRRICVYVVTTCEQLFEHYISKARVLHDRNIFTDHANRSRLKAQIALHSHELLNVLVIRRHIVAELKAQRHLPAFNLHSYQPSISKLTKKPPRIDEEMQKLTGIQRELYEAMPSLDMSDLTPFVINTFSPTEFEEGSETETVQNEKVDHVTFDDGIYNIDSSRQDLEMKRCDSLPCLRGERLLDELGITSLDKRADSVYNLDMSLYGTGEQIDLPRETIIRNDLQHLLQTPKLVASDMPDKDDLPSLLQSIARSGLGETTPDKYRTILREMLEREKEEELKKQQRRVTPPTHSQPSTIDRVMPDRTVVKLSDVRVSNRECLSTMVLHSYPPIYNDLLGEISSDMVKALDKSLYMKGEIREVYEEIMKSISRAHFDVANDKLVEHSPAQLLCLTTKPSIETKCKTRGVIINVSLMKEVDPPWGKGDIFQWCKTPEVSEENTFPCFTPDMDAVHEKRDALCLNSGGNHDIPTLIMEKTKRSYDLWTDWWKANIHINDYKKYISLKNTDYLGVIFHLFIDESRTEFEKKMAEEKALIDAARQKLNEVEMARLKELRGVKKKFETGMWNTLTITMGGLGKDPPLSSRDTASTATTRPSLLIPSPTCTSPHATATPLPFTSPRPSIQVHRTPRASVFSGLEEGQLKSLEMTESDKMLLIQDRLERVWIQLKMPESQRLDMAIKYSGVERFTKLQEVTMQFEHIVHWIAKRESVMCRLEKFERTASDPDRFFQRGKKGSSLARITEAKDRHVFEQLLHSHEKQLKKILDTISTKFGDVVTYNGRSYADKMRWDRLEMLYWLQEERKQNALKFEVVSQDLNIRPSHLQPLFM